MEGKATVLEQSKTAKGKVFDDQKKLNGETMKDGGTENAKKKKSPVRLILLGVILIAGGVFAYNKISFALTHETTDNAQIETQIAPVLTRVSGYVKSIGVGDYDSVKAGQLVVELDDEELQMQLAQMEADYQAAEADIVNAKATLTNAVASTKVNQGNITLNEVKVQQ